MVATFLQRSAPKTAEIRAGQQAPHPRHWQALAKLLGVSGGRIIMPGADDDPN